jgi:hypothetical protein
MTIELVEIYRHGKHNTPEIDTYIVIIVAVLDVYG